MSSATHNSQFWSQNRDKCYNVNAVAGGGTDVQRRGQREGGSKRHERVRCMPTANFGSVLVEEGGGGCRLRCSPPGCSNCFDVTCFAVMLVKTFLSLCIATLMGRKV